MAVSKVFPRSVVLGEQRNTYTHTGTHTHTQTHTHTEAHKHTHTHTHHHPTPHPTTSPPPTHRLVGRHERGMQKKSLWDGGVWGLMHVHDFLMYIHVYTYTCTPLNRYTLFYIHTPVPLHM